MLLSHFQNEVWEAGCDEAGRGCLAGPVFAAAVIFEPDFRHPELNDSKQLTASKRAYLRKEIEKHAVCYSVAKVSASEIDDINIFQASYLAMHKALDQLSEQVGYILVDGKHFVPYKNIPHQCVIKGDGKFLSIAAASILAKTYRDEYMEELASSFPMYDWCKNKGYPTSTHRRAILEHGLSPHHRKSFRVSDPQLKLFDLPACETTSK